MPWYRIPMNLYDRVPLDVRLAGIAAGHPCEGGAVHINFGRSKNVKAPRPCCCCGWISERECDWVVQPGVLIHGKPKTCDAPLCAYCTTSPAPEKDICPAHVGALKAWLAGRTNTVDGQG